MSYNHENYICECLDGFVKQETTFPFEILVHDDASTDNTAFIVKEYEANYPHLFRCVYQTENQYAKQNCLINILFPAAHGKYIALCEGDDYWTDPLKLQKQVDFLEANEDFSLCFTKIGTFRNNNIDNDEHKHYYHKIMGERTEFTIEDIIKDNFIATCSVMFRKKNTINHPEWANQLPFGDWTLSVLNARHGKIKYIDELTGVYRIHEGGIWTSQPIQIRQKWRFDFYLLISKHLDNKYDQIIIRSISETAMEHINHHSSELLEAKQWFQSKLSETQTKLDSILMSKAWRVAIKIGGIFNLFFPKGSAVRRFARVAYMSLSSTYRILKGRYVALKTKLEIIKARLNTVTIINDKWPDDKPLISVIIPCFNYGKYVEEAINSVLNQTFHNFEIIVVDGGSTDGITHGILKNLDKPKTKIYFRDGRHLVGDNRNYGINRAKGKYICCLDADDMLEATYFEKALFYLETYKYDVVYPSVQCFGEKDGIWHASPTTFKNMMNIGNSVSTVAMFNKEAWQKSGGYKDWPIGEGHVPEDWEYWTRLMGKGYRFKNIRERLMYYRVNGIGLTAKNKTSYEEQRSVIYNENKDLLSKEYRKIRHRSNKNYYKVIDSCINLIQPKFKKRILLALPYMIIGGADSILLKIFRSLNNEYDITIITTIETPVEYGDNTTEYKKITDRIYHLRRFLDNKEQMKDFVLYLIESREIDIIFIVGCELVYHLLPEIVKKNKRLKVIDQLFNEFGHLQNNRRYQDLINLNIVANEKIKDILIKDYKEDNEKIKVIMHGIDVENEFNPHNYSCGNDLKCDNKDEFIISFLGRFSEEKAPDLFVEIVNLLKDYKIKAIMIGHGPEYNNILNLIKLNNLIEVIHAPGFVDDIKSIIFMTDIVVVPSRIEGLPIIILESLSMGKPVIASNTGGIPAIIKNDYNGYICEIEDIAGFAEKIKILFDDRNKLFQMKNNAREFALSNISDKNMNIAYQEAMRKLFNE